jgi:pyruvate kinase
MLSGESAAGKYPVEAVRTMAEIAEYTEQHNDYETNFRNIKFEGKDNLDKLSHAVCSMAVDMEAKAVVVCSVSGKTAMLVSRFRTPVDIVGMTTDPKIWRRLSMSWGVTPVLAEEYPNMDVMMYFAKMKAQEALKLEKGANVIITGGPVSRGGGNTNTIKIETV